MPLSEYQKQLIDYHQTNPQTGLTQPQTHQIHNSNPESTLNIVKPPLNCPPWVCCLLPCIKHIPSMSLFAKIQPSDAEVFRDSQWICYDASSLLKGDIIRMTEGDIVPADCTVLSLGMEWNINVRPSPDDYRHSDSYNSNDSNNSHIITSLETLLVDVSNITGEERPHISSMSENGFVSPTKLYYGSNVVQGSCVALVTAVGNHTYLAMRIQEKRWPPKQSGLNGYNSEYSMLDTDEVKGDEEEGDISLSAKN